MNLSIQFLKTKKFNFSLEKKFIKTLPKKVTFKIDPVVENEVEQSDSKQFGLKSFKNHAGRNQVNVTTIPIELSDTIRKVIDSFPVENLTKDADILKTYINQRRTPLEKGERYEIKQSIIDDMKYDDRIFDEEFVNNNLEDEIELKLNAKIHPWKKMNFTKRLAMLYLIARFESEYSAVFNIFNEIKKKDDSFIPKHLFDYGSGLGTVMWAANELWNPYIEEYFNCDSSIHMNTLADLILRGGDISKPNKLKNVSFKLNAPKSAKNQFDLVTSCFTLFEFGSMLERFGVIETLWRNVKDEGYLILVEDGKKHGFKLISQARDFITKELMNDQENEKDSAQQLPKLQIFSPCPHAFECPVVKENKICKFKSSYWPIDMKLNNKKFNKQTIEYSYLVIKKSSLKPKSLNWPRLVVRNPERHGDAMDAYFCSQDGSLNHIISSKNRCKKTLRLLKYSKLGDSLPLTYSNES